MSYYDDQATEFMTKTNTTIDFELVGKDYPKWDKRELHNHYKVTIATPKGKFTDDFWDSVTSTRNGEHPTNYDFLACLTTSVPSTFEDFCAEYDYDTDSISSLNTFHACQKQYENLCSIYTDEQLEELANVN